MAMLALPLAFAGVGYATFGSTGAAVGWLIGAWLFGPKSTEENQIFDPGAQEMPRFNQSLRGATMPILFGTNRVSSNIVWVKNFQTIRKETAGETGGGGKGGGSGMPGKGQQQAGPTTVSYEYKWDMLFHLGMGPEEYSLIAGWSNTQRITTNSIASIVTNSGITAGLGTLTNATGAGNEFTLSFEDAYFGIGSATGDTVATAWAYFTAQEGVACIWPHTYYVGFKALLLGAQATTPQLSFEVGPGGGVFGGTTGFIEDVPGNSVYPHVPNNVVIGEDNKTYALQIYSGSSGSLIRLDDGTILSLTTASMVAAVNTDTGQSFSAAVGNIVLIAHPYTQYFYAGALMNDTNYRQYLGLYKINSSGAIEFVRGHIQNSTSFSLGYWTAFIAGVHYHGGNGGIGSDLLVWHYNVATLDGPYAVRLNSVATFVTGYTSALTWTDRVTSGSATFDTGSFIYTHLETARRAFFHLPIFESLTWKVLACTYLTKGECEYYNANPSFAGDNSVIRTWAALYPDGVVLAAKITYNASAPSIGSLVAINEKFLYNGSAIVPFADAALDINGAEIAGNGLTRSQEDWGQPTVSPDPSGASILIWTRTYGTQASQGTTGTNERHKVLVWNPVSQMASVYAELTVPFADTISDLAGLSRYNSRVAWANTYYRSVDNKVYIVNFYHSGQPIGVNVFVCSTLGTLTITGGSDVTPPYIIRQILTNPIFGVNSRLVVDEASYTLAVQFCEAAFVKVSTQYTREGAMLSSIDQLLALYGGYLAINGGTVKFGVQAFSDVAVRTIDNDHLVIEGDTPPVKIEKPAPQDGFNKIRVNFLDRALDYRQNFVEVSDEVDMDFNGTRFKEFPATFVMSAGLAGQTAIRALWNNLYGRDIYNFTLGWKDCDLEAGDVITLIDSFHPELNAGTRARIVTWNERERGKFQVKAVKEIGDYMNATYTTSAVTNNSDGRLSAYPIEPCREFRMYELPREFQGADASVFVGYNQGSQVRGAELFLSADNVSYALASVVEPFIISGIFGSALAARDHGFVERNHTVYIMPSSGFSTTTPTWAQTIALDDISELSRASGLGVIIAGSEAIAVEGLNLVSQNTYRISKMYRGWGGTAPQAHSSGAYWHKHGTGIFRQTINADKIGTTIYYKVVPYNFAGNPYDVSSITANSYTVRGHYWVPQGPSALSVYVTTPSTLPNTFAGQYKAVTSGGCDVQVGWSDSARMEGHGFAGYGRLGYGHFTADESHTWRVQVMSSTAVVRSTVVTSGPFVYTLAQNSADFNGFAHDFAVRVTPRNSYGDAIWSETRTIGIIW